MPSIEVKNPELVKPEDCPGATLEKLYLEEFTEKAFLVSLVLLVAGGSKFLLGEDG